MQKIFHVLMFLAVLCLAVGAGYLIIVVTTNRDLGEFFLWPMMGALGFLVVGMFCATVMDLRRR